MTVAENTEVTTKPLSSTLLPSPERFPLDLQGENLSEATLPEGTGEAGILGETRSLASNIRLSPTFPSRHEFSQRFLAEQMWEGSVTRIDKASFVARLIDVQTDDEDEAELPLSDVSDDDLELLVPGAAFYFSIGYLFSRDGSRQRCARLRFRRVPRFSPDEILDAHERAAARVRRITFE